MNLTPPATDPFRIAIKKTSSNIVLTWPTNIVCRVQARTNLLSSGTGSPWSSLATSTNQMQITPTAAGGY
ncbi:MAG: hypothetical protein P4N60_05260 [Verrucomicrobiae bacterium]|nr:hypothetical protein [Verrucomicrobiae bacterium]